MRLRRTNRQQATQWAKIPLDQEMEAIWVTYSKANSYVLEVRLQLLTGVNAIGGTICNDGAKWRKRSLVNSVLMTAMGPFYCRSTNATGMFKNGAFLLDDIKGAIATVGEENVFIVALDGACKSTLRMIMDDASMQKIFPQRCTTHGLNLLVAGIGSLFDWEIMMCVRLIKFVSNHDGIFAIFQALPGALQLLGSVETRFASQIYSSERILADKIPLKQLFSGEALQLYLAQRGTPEQRREHTALDDEFISNYETWERIKIFVDVEYPVRRLLRISDGHKPNLPEICFGYEDARKKSLAAVESAQKKYPLKYVTLFVDVTAAFEKRTKDVVTPLCLAACMVLPRHVYTVDGQLPYEPEGGGAELVAVIERYYRGDLPKQIEALKVFQDFRERAGAHFGNPRTIYTALDDTAETFWKTTAIMQPVGSELFRKLCNGYAGQGESERMNKQVKKFRTTVRDRLSHEVTSAYMELDTLNKMETKNESYNKESPYMECLREKVLEIQEEHEELGAIAAADEEEIEMQAVNEDSDDDYDSKIQDQGRNALFLLLDAAANLLDAEADKTGLWSQ